MAKLRPMPHPSVPLVDTSTGVMRSEWVLYFQSREKLALSNIGDVSTAAPANGDVLTFNSTSGLWEPA